MGHRRNADRQRASGEGIQGPTELGGEAMEVRSPIRERRLIDGSGTVWRMRGGELRWSRVERLVRDPAVSVVHVYLDEVKEVPAAEREGLLVRMRPYLKPSGSGPAPGDYTDFVAAEFRADDHRSMLVVEEYC